MRTLLACCVLLQGCASQREDWGTAEAGIAACFRAMDEDPRLADVNAKFARRDPTPAQLADTTVPSDREAEQLRLRVQLTAPCRSARLAAVREHQPLLEPAYIALYYQADQLFDDLQQQTLTFGAANRLSAAALSNFRARERTYFAATEGERTKAADALRREIEAAHSAPPPTPELTCAWDGLNLSCR